MSELPDERDHRGDEPVWLNRTLLVAVLLACVFALSPSGADPDLWGHVQYGRDLLRDGLPATSTYTYTARGYRWINHENFSELVLAVMADHGGAGVMVVAKCLLGLAVVGWMLRQSLRYEGAPLAGGAVVLLASLNLMYQWTVRPHVFTLGYFAALIALLQFAFAGWEGRWHLPIWRGGAGRSGPAGAPHAPGVPAGPRHVGWLWLAPPLLCLWANTHGGFLAGLAVVTLYLALRAGEVVVVRGRAGLPLASRLVLILAATILATFVNPYGPGLHRWLMFALGIPRPEITEWHPWDLASGQTWLFVALLATIVGSLAASRRSLDMTHLVLLGFVAWQAAQHQRHIGFLAILCGFWIAPHFGSLVARLSAARATTEAEPSAAARRLVTCALALAGVLLAIGLAGRLQGIGVQREQYPVSALEFAARHQLRGRMIVTFNWAQYALAALGHPTDERQGVLVSCDGRFRTCYPQEVLDMHFDLILGDLPGKRYRSPASPPIDPTRTLQFGRPDLVLIDRRQQPSARVMHQQAPAWVLLYQDQIAQLWGRADKYDDPARPTYLAAHQRSITDQPQRGSVAWPAFPPQPDRVLPALTGGAPDTVGRDRERNVEAGRG